MFRVDANGASIPAIGLGTWTLRGEACAELVTHALATGYRHVDTATAYGNEADVGQGLRLSGLPRSEVFVTTKVWSSDIAPGDLERSAENSLKRLALGYVDLLLIHWPNPQIPLEGSIKALNAVHRAGLARSIGVSNFPTSLLARAIELSDAPLAANQVEHHPFLDQSKVHALCRRNGMAMISYCPLYRGGRLFETAAVRETAARHGRTPCQIVLRWHVQQDGVVAIPRTTKKQHLEENFAIFDFSLSQAEMAAISALSAANSRICDFGFAPEWDKP